MSAVVPTARLRRDGVVVARSPVPIVVGRGSFVPVAMLAALFAVYASAARVDLILAAAALGGIGGAASLLVHELGHVGAARRLKGVRPVAISLLWLGAGTKFEGAYRSGRDQARVALAGPAASFGLALLLLFGALMPLPRPVQYGLFGLALLNVAIALVSLLPVYPLDGHKFVVGLLWRISGSEQRSRHLVRRAGKAWLVAEGLSCLVLAVERPALGGLAVAFGASIYLQKRLSVRGARRRRPRQPHPGTH
jgi:Zn-dependent protease